MRLIGVEQYRTNWTTNTLLESGSRLFITLTRLPVLLTCLFYFFDFPWTIATNTTISVLIIPAYNFDFLNLAAIYTAPVIGAILGLVVSLLLRYTSIYMLCLCLCPCPCRGYNSFSLTISLKVGHFLFDIIGNLYARFHSGVIEPEARLIMIWLVLPFKLIGYNLIGTALQRHWSYWIVAVGWCMHNFSTIATTAAVGAYLIDAYPEASGESAAWLNFWRTIGGFIIGYVQLEWAASAGTQVEYGIQSGIMAAAFLVVVVLTFFGKRLRRAQGPLKFKTY
jgi:hypothetical protein